MEQHPNPRALALSALRTVERRDAYADVILDGLFVRRPGLSPRDRGLTSHLVYGVLRWRSRLDAHIALAADRPLRKIHPVVLDVLRVGAYQLLFLDRIPQSAAVAESVDLVRAVGLSHAAGFVNAVLRRIGSSEREIALPGDPVERLSLLFGSPRWLVEAWMGEHGAEGAEMLCRAASTIPTVMLRVETLGIGRDDALEELRRAEIEAGPGAFAPDAVWVEGAGDPRGIPLVRKGLAVVQDQASQLVVHALAPQEGWSVLDACGGPGLKATHIAGRVGDRGTVTALDVHPGRARLIREVSERLGRGSIRVETADAREYRSRTRFDAILVDAPCSGLGVLARNPEAKWRRKPEDLVALASLQLSILSAVADLLRPGGVLVYATCTTRRAENEDVVEAFLRDRPDFSVEALPPGPVEWNGLMSRDGFLRTYPEHLGERGGRALDGFFAARLRQGGASKSC